jgi:hypothetical protein
VLHAKAHYPNFGKQRLTNGPLPPGHCHLPQYRPAYLATAYATGATSHMPAMPLERL